MGKSSNLSRWEKIAVRNKEKGIGSIEKSEKSRLFDELSGVDRVQVKVKVNETQKILKKSKN